MTVDEQAVHYPSQTGLVSIQYPEGMEGLMVWVRRPNHEPGVGLRDSGHLRLRSTLPTFRDFHSTKQKWNSVIALSLRLSTSFIIPPVRGFKIEYKEINDLSESSQVPVQSVPF